MLKLRIYSDLHLELGRFHPVFGTDYGEDLVILAGDIDVGTGAIEWATNRFAGRPVVYVLGNHEYYHQEFGNLVERCRAAARGTSVHVLENDVLDFRGVRILGATLWTDFAAVGESLIKRCVDWARDELGDYAVIRDGTAPLRPQRTMARHAQSRLWLEQQIQAARGPLIVVTHHAPTARTGHPLFAGQINSTASHSLCDDLIRPPIRVWVHGHTHHNVDRQVNGVRVFTNQWGYPCTPAQGFREDGLFELDV
ncbi:serine/threonine protein phosphatase [Sinimarinibacterium sp. CAU 1509]|uniref:metallophosphoesterase n=1 Tax=Sinimarinibacterium sp. CAU 1509 TaxID=2562283 RepID=UPI0010AD2A32|nr:metallophosphoesterase [Sinimarinibacterium sp. CAU 1509]TJY56203.1 serine/threonine protein phosphatase [Sinimarinibacterium sp. CAU 1509]